MTTAEKVNQPDETRPSSSSEQTERISKSRAVSRWMVFFLLIIAGCAAMSVYLLVQWRQETLHELHSLRVKVHGLKTQHDNTVNELSKTVQSLQTSESHWNDLDKQLNDVLQQQKYKVTDWALLKARSYLELAQMNASWGHNLEETSSLLGQADKTLEDIHEQRLFDVRRAIAEEMTHLKTMEKRDVVGLLSQLDAAQQLTSSILIRQIPKQAIASIPAESVNPSTPSGWRQYVQEGLKVLKKLVVVRRVTDDIQPLVSPELSSILRASIQLTLQETQLAVLREDESLYQLTLKQTIQKVTQFFDPQDKNTVALLKQLESLQQQSIVQKKIDVGQSLLLLNQLINSKENKDQVTHDKADAGAPLS